MTMKIRERKILNQQKSGTLAKMEIRKAVDLLTMFRNWLCILPKSGFITA